jgi:hypothetical protein
VFGQECDLSLTRLGCEFLCLLNWSEGLSLVPSVCEGARSQLFDQCFAQVKRPEKLQKVLVKCLSERSYNDLNDDCREFLIVVDVRTNGFSSLDLILLV